MIRASEPTHLTGHEWPEDRMDKSDAEALWPLSKRTVRTLRYGQIANIGGTFVVVDVGESTVSYMMLISGEKPDMLLEEFKRRGAHRRRKSKVAAKSLDNRPQIGTN